MRYRVEQEKRNSISPSNHVLLCLLYKPKSSQYYWNNFYSVTRAAAVSVIAKGKSNSSSTDSNKQFSITFINTIENFSLLFYFHFIIATFYCFICPYSLVGSLKSPYLLAPDLTWDVNDWNNTYRLTRIWSSSNLAKSQLAARCRSVHTDWSKVSSLNREIRLNKCLSNNSTVERWTRLAVAEM